MTDFGVTQVFVTKRDGRIEPFDESKIQAHAEWACEGLDVSQSELEANLHLMFYDKIHTDEIAKGLIMAAATLISEKQPDYTYVAARLTLQKIYKDVTGGAIVYPRLESYLETGVRLEQLDDRLVDGRFDLNALDRAIVSERDFLFDYLGIQTFEDRYLLRVPGGKGKRGRVYELPQHLFMRVAMGLALNEPNPTKAAIDFYNVISAMLYMPSTPTLFNAGTRFPQLSSCYGQTVPDSLEGIFDLGYKESAQLSKFSGGIGTDWTRLRASGSPPVSG